MQKWPQFRNESPDLQGCDRHSIGLNAMNEQLKADLSSQQGRSSLRDVWPEVPAGTVVYANGAVGCLWLPGELSNRINRHPRGGGKGHMQGPEQQRQCKDQQSSHFTIDPYCCTVFLKSFLLSDPEAAARGQTSHQCNYSPALASPTRRLC